MPLLDTKLRNKRIKLRIDRVFKDVSPFKLVKLATACYNRVTLFIDKEQMIKQMSKDAKFLRAIRDPEKYDVLDEEYLVMQMVIAR